MLRAKTILPAGHWDGKIERGTVTLGWDDRHRRRIALRTDQGDDFLLDLADAARLAEGDGLALEDGSAIRVIAAPEPVLEIRAGQTGLARLAYHLGNRHLPVQIAGELLVIRADAVIAEMVVGLGGHCHETLRPFTPEAGAYDVPAASHHADHDHDGGHDHDHGHHHEHHHSHD